MASCAWEIPKKIGYLQSADKHLQSTVSAILSYYTAPSAFKRVNDGEHPYFSSMLELEYGVTEQYATELMQEGLLNPAPETVISPVFAGRTATEFSVKKCHSTRCFTWNMKTLIRRRVSKWKPAAGSIRLTRPRRRRRIANGSWKHGWFFRRISVRCCHSEAHEGEHEGHFALGLELYGGLGDMQRFGLEPRRQEDYLQPVFMWHINEHMMLHVGLAIGLSKTSDNLVRTALAFEF